MRMVTRWLFAAAICGILGCSGESGPPSADGNAPTQNQPRPPGPLAEALSPKLRTLASLIPAPDGDGGYIGSSGCKSCHQKEFTSWHGSYHRTMTQVAGP